MKPRTILTAPTAAFFTAPLAYAQASRENVACVIGTHKH